MKEYRKYNLIGNQIADAGTEWMSEKDVALWEQIKDYALIEVGKEPSNLKELTIENGQLVPATPEVIAERQRLKLLTQREAIRAERQRIYDSEAISSLYWNWIESSDEVDKQLWIEAKNQVRQELPYPEINNL